MDFLAHAFWTNLIYQQADPATRYLAIVLGTAPDVVSFAPELVRSAVGRRLKAWRKVDQNNIQQISRSIPWWVYRLYDITHSIPIWLAGFGIWWWAAGRIPWAAFAWLIHILVDIPTHSIRFFPTPFLWPLSDFKVNGISWGEKWFMRLNYGSLIVLYAYFYLIR
jgi:hypothetical protein